MLTPGYKKKFIKDLKRMKKRGKQTNKFENVIRQFVAGKELAKQYLDHSLKGEYSDCRECHIEPDWLLIYIIQDTTIIFVRIGTHADLF